ncbi:MAG: energy transducer TonB, partial [Bacteroidales bacterium]|nr:energy transducer TonB [Bacteroidales bacterium]
RCEGSALVKVDLEVRPDGTVRNVSVVSVETLRDPGCFTEAAQNAALTSTFRSDYSASERQRARITYQFVAQ